MTGTTVEYSLAAQAPIRAVTTQSGRYPQASAKLQAGLSLQACGTPKQALQQLLREQFPPSDTTGLHAASGIDNELPACCAVSSNLTRRLLPALKPHLLGNISRSTETERDTALPTCSTFQRSFKNHTTTTQTLALCKPPSLLLSSLAC